MELEECAMLLSGSRIRKRVFQYRRVEKMSLQIRAKLHPLTIEQNALTSFRAEPLWFRAGQIP